MVKVFICCNDLASARIALRQPGASSFKASLNSIASNGAVGAPKDVDVSGSKWTAFIAHANCTTDLLKTSPALMHFEFE
jgi:hypothetical protein